MHGGADQRGAVTRMVERKRLRYSVWVVASVRRKARIRVSVE